MTIALCHPSRKHYAKGKCGPCWKRQFYSTPDQLAKKIERWEIYYANNRTKILTREKEWNILKAYGLTLAEYKVLLAQPCAICGGKSVHLDHDHVTGLIRSALCRLCSIGLGAFHDRSDLLVKAAAYLQ